jgi:hypothetical protein
MPNESNAEPSLEPPKTEKESSSQVQKPGSIKQFLHLAYKCFSGELGWQQAAHLWLEEHPVKRGYYIATFVLLATLCYWLYQRTETKVEESERERNRAVLTAHRERDDALREKSESKADLRSLQQKLTMYETRVIGSLERSNALLQAERTNSFALGPHITRPRPTWTYMLKLTNGAMVEPGAYGFPVGLQPNIEQVGIIFDVTSSLIETEIRISKFEIEVIKFESTELFGVTQAGEFKIRQFTCNLNTNIGRYVCTRTDSNTLTTLKLKPGEMETIVIRPRSEFQGIYTVAIWMECVVGDEFRRFRLGTLDRFGFFGKKTSL